MFKKKYLILIFASVLFVLFQNFSVPQRVLPAHKKFESSEINPQKRLADLVKFEVGNDAIENIKSKFQIDIGGGDRAPASEEKSSEPTEARPLDYKIANLRTIRIRDEDKQLNCRFDSNGINFVFQQKLSSTASYSIEHNTEQQKSTAKLQISW